MKDKHLKLLRILYENDIVNSNILSSLLNVSTRQIRTYIKEINEEKPDFVLSSNKGYYLNTNKYKDSISESNQSIANFSRSSRRDYITQVLLSGKLSNVFDLADECFVSTSTIESDLQNIKKRLESFDLTITTSNYDIEIKGKEVDKRKLMNSILKDSKVLDFNYHNEVKLLVDYYNFENINTDIRKILVKNAIFANDYAINAIVLHVVIMMDRSKYRKILPEHGKIINLQDSSSGKVVKDIATLVYEKYSIEVDTNELYQLLLVIDNNTSSVDYSIVNIANMHDYLSPMTTEVTELFVKLMESKFYIGNIDDNFIVKFAIHINNLLNRTKVGHHIKNPYKEHLKNQHPYIYDIGVFFAYKLQRVYNITISDDEIAFLALHVGGQLQVTNESLNKLNAVFVYSDYNELYMSLYYELSKLFSAKITITEVLPYKNFMMSTSLKSSNNIDIIFTTQQMTNDAKEIVVGHFLSEQVISNIYEKISLATQKKSNDEFIKNVKSFFKPNLFHYSTDKNYTRYQIIDWITNKTTALNYTIEGFLEEIISREKLSDTNFNTVAIPHSLSSSVEQSFVYTYIAKEPVRWGKSNVNLILLIGINQKEIREFSSLYDMLVQKLNTPSIIADLLKSQDFDTFIDTLTRLIYSH